MMEYISQMLILRKCPACRVWNWQELKPYNFKNGCQCSNCNHHWPCRITVADHIGWEHKLKEIEGQQQTGTDQ